MTTVRI